MVKVLAIIPARKNSRAIKNKNLVTFNKKPLIFWTIIAALKSKYVDKTIVSTDSEKIQIYAKKYGVATPHLRPKRLSSHNALTKDVINYELEKIEDNEKYDLVMTLQPTSPLRTYKHINESMMLFLKNKKADSLVSCIKIPHNYSPESTMKIKNGLLKKSKYSREIFNRNLKQDYYARNGAAIYITKKSKIKKYIFGGKIVPYIMDYFSSIDIDDHKDLIIAKKFLTLQK